MVNGTEPSPSVIDKRIPHGDRNVYGTRFNIHREKVKLIYRSRAGRNRG